MAETAQKFGVKKGDEASEKKARDRSDPPIDEQRDAKDANLALEAEWEEVADEPLIIRSEPEQEPPREPQREAKDVNLALQSRAATDRPGPMSPAQIGMPRTRVTRRKAGRFPYVSYMLLFFGVAIATAAIVLAIG